MLIENPPEYIFPSLLHHVPNSALPLTVVEQRWGVLSEKGAHWRGQKQIPL